MTSDRFNKHLIISTLCLVAIIFSCVVAALSWYGNDIAPSLDKLTYAVLGYLIGLLGRTSTEPTPPPTGAPGDPVQAEIVNTPQAPVQVQEAVDTPQDEEPHFIDPGDVNIKDKGKE